MENPRNRQYVLRSCFETFKNALLHAPVRRNVDYQQSSIVHRRILGTIDCTEFNWNSCNAQSSDWSPMDAAISRKRIHCIKYAWINRLSLVRQRYIGDTEYAPSNFRNLRSIYFYGGSISQKAMLTKWQLLSLSEADFSESLFLAH
jgi:hypothetical protein